MNRGVIQWRWIIMTIAVAIVFYFALVILSNVDEVLDAASHFQWFYILPTIGLVAVNYIVRAERWHLYLKSISLGLPRNSSYWLFLSGLSMSITPAKSGEVLKALLLKVERGALVERGVAVVFVERMTDIIGMLILIAIGSFSIAYGLVSVAIITAAIVVILVIIQIESLVNSLTGRMMRRPRFASLGRMVTNAYRDAKGLLRGRALAYGIALSVIAWLAMCIAFYILLLGCSAQVSPLESIFIFAFSSTIGAVSMLPGGIGITEVSMIGLLSLISVSLATASFAVILTIVCTLWFAVAIGSFFLILFIRHSRSRIDENRKNADGLA